jgi:hypothetical protein
MVKTRRVWVSGEFISNARPDSDIDIYTVSSFLAPFLCRRRFIIFGCFVIFVKFVVGTAQIQIQRFLSCRACY